MSSTALMRRNLRAMSYRPLSMDEMQELLPGVRIYIYRQLAEMQELPPLPFVLLYEIEPNNGHWVLVTETPEGIEHFDSYGLKPDGEFSFVPLMFRAKSGQASPHLVKLLLDTGRPINFSGAKLQSVRAPYATCGRWVTVRQTFNDLKSADFIKMIKKAAERHGLNNDELVTALVPV